MGVTFEQFNSMVGVISAATRQSGSEVGNSLKAILPRLTQKTGQSTLAKLGVGLTDQAGNMRDVISIYKEVAEKMKDMNEVEKAQVTMGLGGTYHRTRLQALLNDLGQVDSMYDKMENSASNESEGSAMRENDTYMQSLQARIGVMKASFQELSISIGEAFLSEGMITFFETLAAGIQLLTKLTSVVGALPVGFASIVAITFLASKRFRELMASVWGYGASAVTAGIKTDTLKAKLIGMAKAATNAGFSLRALGAATGVGLAIAALGFAFEKLAKKQEEARQRAEELENQNKQLKASYAENKDSVADVLSSMSALEEKSGTPDYNLEDEKKYVSLKNELAKLLPSLSLGTDSYGNSIVGNSKAVANHVKVLEEQLAIEQKLADAKKTADAEENIKTSKKDLKKYNKKTNQSKNLMDFYANKTVRANDRIGKVSINEDDSSEVVLEKASKRIDELRKLSDELKKEGKESLAKTVKNQADDLSEELGNFSNKATLLSAKTTDLNNSISVFATSAINSTNKIGDNGKDFLNNFVTYLNSTQQEAESLEQFFDSFKVELNTKDFQSSMNDLNSIIEETKNNQEKFKIGEIDSKTFEETKKQLEKQIDEILEKLKKMGEDNGLNMDSAISSLKDSTSSLYGLDSAAKTAGKTVEETGASISGMGEVSEETASEIDSITASLTNFSNASEAAAGITQQGMDSVNNAIQAYNLLNGTVEKGTIQYDYYQQQMQILIGLYPQLESMLRGSAEQQQKAIGIIESEMKSRESLMAAYKLEAQGKLSMEGQKTSKQLTETNSRISLINQEIAAINTLIQGYQKAMAAAQEVVNAGDKDSSTIYDSYGSAEYNMQRYQSEIESETKKLQTKEATLADLATAQSIQTSTLDTQVEASQKAADAADKSSSSTKKSTSASKDKADANLKEKKSLLELNTELDIYKNTLAEIELQITKQNNAQARYAKGSKAYRDSVRKEITLLEKKIGVLKEQSSTQRAVAKIEASTDDPYTYLSSSSSSSSTSSSSSSGTKYNGKYSSYINKYAKKYGVDAALITAVIKQESNFNANATSSAGAKGLMQLMPNTAKSLGVSNAYNAEQNIMGGTKYLSQLLKQFNGDIKKTLAGYNAGPNRQAIRNGQYNLLPKETQNYITKVSSYYSSYSKSITANTKAVTSNTKATKTTKKLLSGWQGTITSGYGDKRSAASKTGGKHIGVDVSYAGIYGKKLESNVSGKVKFAGRKSGQTGAIEGQKVVVVDASGKEHSYKHLKSVNVKTGDNVSVGSNLGQIGGKTKSEGITNKSKNGHLHYDVKNKSGKYIDPTSLVKALIGKKVAVGGGTTSVSGVKSVDSSATGIPDYTSAISSQEEWLNTMNEISDLITDLIDSSIDNWEKKIDKLEDLNSLYSTRQSQYGDHSKTYRKFNNQQIKTSTNAMKATKSERNYVKSTLDRGYYEVGGKKYKLTTAQIETYQDKLRELNVSLSEYANKIRELRFDNITSKLNSFADALDKLESKTTLAEARRSQTITYSKFDKTQLNTQLTSANSSYKQAQSQSKYIKAQIDAEKKRKPLTSAQAKSTNKKLKTAESKEDKAEKRIKANQNKLKTKLTKKEKAAIEKKIASDKKVVSAQKTLIKKYKAELSKNYQLSPADRAELNKKYTEAKIEEQNRKLELAEASMNKIQARKDNVDYKVSKKEYIKNRNDYLRNQTDSSSLKSRKITDDNIKAMKDQIALKRQEMNQTVQDMKKSNLTPAKVRELQETLDATKLELLELNEAIQAETEIRLNSIIEGYDNKVSEYDFLKQMSQIYQSIITDTNSSAYLNETTKQSDLDMKSIEQLMKKAEVLETASQDVAQYSYEQREGFVTQWREVQQQIANTVKEGLDSNKTLADNYVSLMKTAYEKKKDLALKAIEKESKAYSKLINDMIKAIDDAEEKTSHEEDRSDKQEEIDKKKKKISELSLDDSQLAKAERKKLQEELAELEKEYSKWERQYNNEQKKEALQEQLDEKTEQLEKEQEKIERFYENILEDEERWAKMSSDIMAGQVTTYIAEFEKMGLTITANASTIGESISKTLVKQFDDAIASMKSLQEETTAYQEQLESLNSSGFFGKTIKPAEENNESRTDINASSGDMKYVTGKTVTMTANSDGSGKTTKLSAGSVVTMNSSNNGTSKITLADGSTGYVNYDDLESSYSKSSDYKTLAKNSNLYTSASSSSKSQGVVKEGTKVEVLGTSGNFTKVSYDGKIGYISTGRINATSGTTTKTTTTVSGNTSTTSTTKTSDYATKYAQKAGVVYKTASTKGTVLQKVSAGKSIKVAASGASNGFSKVVIDGKTGYIKTSLLGASSPTKPNTTGTSTKGNEKKRKTTEKVAFYKDSKKKASYGNVGASKIVELASTAIATGMQKVKYNGKTGYIDAQKIKKFDTGGMTGNWSGNEGRLAMLHKKEWVLTEGQTDNLMETIKIMAKNSLGGANTTVPKLEVPELKMSVDGGNNFNYENLFTIENFNGSQKEVDSLSRKIVDGLNKAGINTSFRRRK